MAFSLNSSRVPSGRLPSSGMANQRMSMNRTRSLKGKPNYLIFGDRNDNDNVIDSEPLQNDSRDLHDFQLTSTVAGQRYSSYNQADADDEAPKYENIPSVTDFLHNTVPTVPITNDSEFGTARKDRYAIFDDSTSFGIHDADCTVSGI